MPTLVALDALGVQEYVFASNRLRDVVMASAQLVKLTGHSFVADGPGAGDCLQAAGGNVIVRFEHRADAATFLRVKTRQLIDEAPGLEVAVSVVDYEPSGLAQAFMDINKQLRIEKRTRKSSVPLGSLPVTTVCRSTGRPAIGLPRKGAAVPSGALALLAEDPKANPDERWGKLLACLPQSYEFPLEIDKLG